VEYVNRLAFRRTNREKGFSEKLLRQPDVWVQRTWWIWHLQI